MIGKRTFPVAGLRLCGFATNKPRETPREPKAETHNQAAAPGGFGAGVKPEANGAPKRKRSKPAADKPKPRAASADKPAQDKPRPNSSGGFGAGI